jgi:two-component system, OmpR family, alkaline phosphatase synthesis response regulator PhoP
MNHTTVLVIEDEADILELVIYNLSREGFAASGCRDGLEGLRRAQKDLPGLILLDLMLPGLDGIEICRRLRADAATRHIPVIMVTAKGEESDIVLGLSMGADDYVTKPFSPRELLARVRAVLRRGAARDEPLSVLRIIRDAASPVDGLTIDPQRFEVLVDGRSVEFTATEFRLLHSLAAHAGRVFTREMLVSQAIGEDAVVIDRNIDVHVRALRKKLGRFSGLVETVRGVGYRFKDEPL